MGYIKSMHAVLHCYTKQLELDVEYEYSYDSGVDIHSNGDRVYPPSLHWIDIKSVTNGNGTDLSPMFDRMDKLFDGGDEYISPWDRVIEEMSQEDV